MCTETDTTNYEDWNPLDLTGEQAQAIVYKDSYRFKVIEDNITDTSRWSEIHTAIIEDKKTNKFYRAYYSQGATENQEEKAYEYDSNVSFEEVKKVPMESYKWVKVK